jgi:hypothetical protein
MLGKVQNAIDSECKARYIRPEVFMAVTMKMPSSGM